MTEDSLTNFNSEELGRHTEAWQGMFSGFMEASRRDDVEPRCYLRQCDAKIGPNMEHQVHIVVRPVFIDNFTGYPTSLLMTIDQDGTPMAQAAAEVEWKGETVFLKKVEYIENKHLGLNKENFIVVINDLGGAFEQPLEY